MALKTNFTDDILAESMNGKRQYNVTENSNGTKSLEDATDYQSVGSTFSAKDMNETNAAVNQAYDDMGDEFNPEVDYAVGDYTIHNNKVWKFTTAHPAGAWDESHVKAIKILSEARELTENLKSRISLHKLATFKSANTVNVDTTAYSVFVIIWERNNYSGNSTITTKNILTLASDFRYSGTSNVIEGMSHANVTIFDDKIKCSSLLYTGNYISSWVSVYGLGLTS